MNKNVYVCSYLFLGSKFLRFGINKHIFYILFYSIYSLHFFWVGGGGVSSENSKVPLK